MNRIKLQTTQILVATILLCLAHFAQAQVNDQSINRTAPNDDAISNSSIPASQEQTKFAFVPEQTVNVTNVEELYAAVNDTANAGNQIVMAAGVYQLSVNNPGGTARPNGGRLELQENMSLKGVIGDRGAVIIDAINLPSASYTTPIASPSGAIRTGKGSNSVEWLTIRNAVSGGAGIIAHLSASGTAYVRIAHIAATGNTRGIDIRNVGGGAASTANYALETEIVDNDLYNNRAGSGFGLRIINFQGGSGNVLVANLSGNRSYNNNAGIVVENFGSTNFGNISVYSAGDRFFENGAGGVVGGALGATGTGDTVNFTANGTSFENNNATSPFDLGGLVILGAENTTTANALSNNTANVTLRNCRLTNNQLYNIGAFGARSNPATVGLPGTNNRVRIRLYGTLVSNLVTTDSLPDSPGGMNSVTVIRSPVTSNFDYDGDGRADLAVFRPTDRTWYLNRPPANFFATQFGLATDKLVPADFDGDGKTDIAVFRDGTWYWSNSSNGSIGIRQFGLTGDIPQPADFDGDGRTELCVYRNGTWWTLNLATTQVSTVQFGTAADKPITGDFDGDGRADYAYYRGNGEWNLNRSSQGLATVNFGLSTDKTVPADYDGDGKTDLAVFRPLEGNWYVLNSATNNLQVINWGLVNDALVPSDYDGDGKADVAVFRNGTWYIRQTFGGLNYANFGSGGDVPTNQVQ